MTSFRQIQANRRNALKSTGPSSEEGAMPYATASHREVHKVGRESLVDGRSPSLTASGQRA